MEKNRWTKSRLQETLESQGWEFLTNENPTREGHRKYLRGLPEQFGEVRIEEEAYDCDGNSIPGYKAVYVKREKPKVA